MNTKKEAFVVMEEIDGNIYEHRPVEIWFDEKKAQAAVEAHNDKDTLDSEMKMNRVIEFRFITSIPIKTNQNTKGETMKRAERDKDGFMSYETFMVSKGINPNKTAPVRSKLPRTRYLPTFEELWELIWNHKVMLIEKDTYKISPNTFLKLKTPPIKLIFGSRAIARYGYAYESWWSFMTRDVDRLEQLARDYLAWCRKQNGIRLRS